MNTIIFSAIAGVILMFSGAFLKRVALYRGLTIVLLLAILIGNVLETYGMPLFHINTMQMLKFEKWGMFFNSIAIASVLFFVLISGDEVEKINQYTADYFALLFFILSGIGVLTSFNNLLMMFLGIEIMSIPLYILTGSKKQHLKSNEAALKYFLMGSFSTGVMLMGIALIYGAQGTFSIEPLTTIVGTVRFSVLSVSGLVLVLIAMAFKVSAAPFHFWTPDVYDGAPTVFTSFMSTIIKAAAFFAFIKLFDGKHVELGYGWRLLIGFLIVLTLLVGNITAVFQQSVKRMLAYSSIAQAGFMLFALYSNNDLSREGFLLYAVAYTLATIGIFAVLLKMKDDSFEGFNGLAKSQPLLALTTTICLLSLAGIPLTAGFFAKYYMLASAIKTGQGNWLVVLAVLFAAVSVYYYFKVIQAMYFKTGDAQTSNISTPLKWGMFIVSVLIIILGVLPNALLHWFYF